MPKNAGFGLEHHHNMRAILLLETKRMRNFIPLYNDFDYVQKAHNAIVGGQ